MVRKRQKADKLMTHIFYEINGNEHTNLNETYSTVDVDNLSFHPTSYPLGHW